MGAGVYGVDVTTTIRGSLVINRSGGIVAPSNFSGVKVVGNDDPAMPPA